MNVGLEKNILENNSMTFDERQRQLDQERKQEEEQRKREKQSPFSNWYQMNREHSDKMIWLATNHPKAHGILLFLLDQMDNYNAIICSSQVLQEALGISRTTVFRALTILNEKGFIATYKSGTSNVYVVNDDLAWSSWGDNRKYCKFPANVILSATENQTILDTIKASKMKMVEIKEYK